jgi:hypothetical protein
MAAFDEFRRSIVHVLAHTCRVGHIDLRQNEDRASMLHSSISM